MKRITAITTVVVSIALGAVACGGGGAVTIPTAAELAATYGTLHSESNPRPVATYCEVEAEAVEALEPLLRGSVTPSDSAASLEEAVSYAGRAVDVAPSGVAQDALLRSRFLGNFFDSIIAGGFDVGRIGSSARRARSQQFLAAVDRISAYDLRVCGIAKG